MACSSSWHCGLQGIELGLRALVAAGAESVMVLHTGCQLSFQPERDSKGKLGNAAAFEDYIGEVQQRGKS